MLGLNHTERQRAQDGPMPPPDDERLEALFRLDDFHEEHLAPAASLGLYLVVVVIALAALVGLAWRGIVAWSG